MNNFFDNEEWAASINLSQDQDIGVLPPGLISNEEDFFILRGPENEQREVQKQVSSSSKDLALKPGLRVNINYRAVNPNVWYLFYTNYGGQATVPQLPREAIDIYSRDMSHIIKIYYGQGNILPQHKLASLLLIGQETVNHVLHKDKKGMRRDKASKSKRDLYITTKTNSGLSNETSASQRLRQEKLLNSS